LGSRFTERQERFGALDALLLPDGAGIHWIGLFVYVNELMWKQASTTEQDREYSLLFIHWYKYEDLCITYEPF
jgi:hypothetical protein